MLSYVDQGAGSGVLLLHGFALDLRMWEPQIAALRGKHRLVAVNLPGFGPDASPALDGVSAARAALEVLDALELDRVHVIGLSLGGAIAADFAMAFPHRVRTLVLASAVLRGEKPGVVAWPRCVELARAGQLREAKQAWLADPLFSPSLERADTAARLRAMVADYGGAHWRGEASTGFESADPPGARLAELRAPTLVVVGARDLPSFRGMADAYASKLPHARKVVLEGAGHMPNLEAAEAFNAAVAAFFEA
jgi:pimeloyl-ACP methyl ester carboxylesterase